MTGSPAAVAWYLWWEYGPYAGCIAAWASVVVMICRQQPLRRPPPVPEFLLAAHDMRHDPAPVPLGQYRCETCGGLHRKRREPEVPYVPVYDEGGFAGMMRRVPR